MSSVYGEFLKLSIFGQSHSPAIGMVLDGIPAGLAVDEQALAAFLRRRAPGQNAQSTPRRETDAVQFLGGILDGYTCGAPIAAVIPNTNTRSADYANLKDCPRPGHADFTAQIKYGGFQDTAGGGHFSGRLTAPLCVAGGLCSQWLAEKHIRIGARILRIAGCPRQDAFLEPTAPDLDSIATDFPTVDPQAGLEMRRAIDAARTSGDSAGGVIECFVTGLPAGIGEPMFGGVESRIAQIVYGIPAVKGLEFGLGFAAADCRGSQCNDPFYMDGSAVRTRTNHAGGILGGITNAMPLQFRVAIKPTPSISRPQQSVCLSQGTEQILEIHGRHDPCIVPRAVPVVEAAAAVALYDLILGNTQTERRKTSWT